MEESELAKYDDPACRDAPHALALSDILLVIYIIIFLN